MRVFHARGVVLALGLAMLASGARGNEPLGQPSLLPLPPVETPVRQVAHRDFYQDDSSPAPPMGTLPSPSDQLGNGGPVTIPTPDPTLVSPDYHGAMGQSWGGSDIGCADGVCGVGCACPNTWYGYGGGLFMTRDARHGFNTSIDDWDSTVVLSNCGCMTGKWVGGFEATIGRTFNCCQNAIEVTYWGLYPEEQWRDAWGSDVQGNLNTTWNFNDIDYDDGNGNSGPVQDWYNNSQHHSIHTQYNVQNVEVNLLGQTCGGGLFGCGPYGACTNCCGPRFNFAWAAGLRYFQFNENFAFGSDDVDTVWDGSPNELWYEVETTNSMLGFQLGSSISYRFCNCWQLYVNGKAGVFGNHATSWQSVYGSNGYATINNGGWTGEEYFIHSSETDLAMLAQLDVGARWQLTKCLSARFGYRAVGVSGVALIADQLPTDFSNVDVISDINTNGSLLLHGGYAGLEFCF